MGYTTQDAINNARGTNGTRESLLDRLEERHGLGYTGGSVNSSALLISAHYVRVDDGADVWLIHAEDYVDAVAEVAGRIVAGALDDPSAVYQDLCDRATPLHSVIGAAEHRHWPAALAGIQDLHGEAEAIDVASALSWNLDGLLRLVRADLLGDDLDSMPTFGGAAPESGTGGVWSWDDGWLLVGTCAADMRIVDREEWAEEREAVARG